MRLFGHISLHIQRDLIKQLLNMPFEYRLSLAHRAVILGLRFLIYLNVRVVVRGLEWSHWLTSQYRVVIGWRPRFWVLFWLRGMWRWIIRRRVSSPWSMSWTRGGIVTISWKRIVFFLVTSDTLEIILKQASQWNISRPQLAQWQMFRILMLMNTRVLLIKSPSLSETCD